MLLLYSRLTIVYIYEIKHINMFFSDAFDLRFGVGILRLQAGLDFSHLSQTFSSNVTEGKKSE